MVPPLPWEMRGMIPLRDGRVNPVAPAVLVEPSSCRARRRTLAFGGAAGWVAEWFKAAVLKCARTPPTRYRLVARSEDFFQFRTFGRPSSTVVSSGILRCPVPIWVPVPPAMHKGKGPPPYQAVPQYSVASSRSAGWPSAAQSSTFPSMAANALTMTTLGGGWGSAMPERQAADPIGVPVWVEPRRAVLTAAPAVAAGRPAFTAS